MTKQKVVIRLSMSGKKSRSKALQVAVGVPGVESFAVKDNDQIELTGEGIQIYELIMLLKKTKNVCSVDLVSVTPVGDQKKPEKPAPAPTPVPVPAPIWLNSYQYGAVAPYNEVWDNSHDPRCSIM